MNAIKPVMMASLFLCAGNAFAQSVDMEPAAVVELRGATGSNVKDGGSYAAFHSSLDRMVHRPSIQEALDALEKSGVHVWRWSGVGSYDEIRHDNELHQR